MTKPISIKYTKRMLHEILSLVPLALLVLSIIIVFPYASLMPPKTKDIVAIDPLKAKCSFVDLNESVEARVFEIVRSASEDNISNLKTDLSLATIPEEPLISLIETSPRLKVTPIPVPSCEIIPLPKTMAAEPLTQLEPIASESTTNEVTLTFSKEEMLKITIDKKEK